MIQFTVNYHAVLIFWYLNLAELQKKTIMFCIMDQFLTLCRDPFLALITGLIAGLIFSACKLPLPAPPVLPGIIGILGIYLGGVLWKMLTS